MSRGVRNGSSVRRRMLARRLRLLREAAGLTLADAAPALDWSVSKLSRIEIAQVGVDVHGVRSMLDLYGAADQWTELVELAREANQRGWYRASGFYVLSFGDIGEPDMAYVEHALGAVHLEKEAEVSLARLEFDQLRSLALAPAESLALVERALAES